MSVDEKNRAQRLKELARRVISDNTVNTADGTFTFTEGIVARAYLDALDENERLHETVIELMEILQDFSDDVKTVFPEYTDRDREKYFPSLARAKKIRLAFGDLHDPN